MNLSELIFDKKVVINYLQQINAGDLNNNQRAVKNYLYTCAVEFAVKYFYDNSKVRCGLTLTFDLDKKNNMLINHHDDNEIIISFYEIDEPKVTDHEINYYYFWADKLRKNAKYITVVDTDGFSEVGKYILDKFVISDKIENEIGLKFRTDNSEFIEEPILITDEIPEYWQGEPKNLIPSNRCGFINRSQHQSTGVVAD